MAQEVAPVPLSIAKYELTSTLSKFLDRHLVFPLLEFLQENHVYDEEDVFKAKLQLLRETNMVDFAMDIYKALYETEDVPPEMRDRRSDVVARLRSLQAEVRPMYECLNDQNIIRNFRGEKAYNLQLLREEYSIGPEHVEAMYQYAKFQYDCGNYSDAAGLLEPYKSYLCSNPERIMSATWGKLAANVLLQKWDDAMEDVTALKNDIEHQNSREELMQLQQRTWLMHWSLFVFWNHDNGKNALVDLFFQPLYLAAIQINAQHLLRYLATAVLINKRRRNLLRELVKLVQQEAYEYSDPITEFVVCLFVNYDFDGAQQKLKECAQVLSTDFFLAACKDEFMENARLFIFETYCRIHKCIDIRMLSEKLNMDLEEAEKWVANLILNAKLNAKIDSQAGTVVMGTQSQSVHEQLIDKAKALSIRTFQLANAVVGTARS